MKASVEVAQDKIVEYSSQLTEFNKEIQQLKVEVESLQEQNLLLKSGDEKNKNTLTNLREQIASNNEQVSIIY